MFTHRTREGKRIPLSELETSHIEAIIRLHKRKAIEGAKIRQGGGSDPDSFWYEERTVYGDEALKALHHGKYVEELQRRLPPPFMGFDELRH